MLNWIKCFFGFHRFYFNDWHHCDDMKIHEFTYCGNCNAMFIYQRKDMDNI